jgi:uncharacterized membrane protein YdjX (TVP38/TMEM64 family)
LTSPVESAPEPSAEPVLAGRPPWVRIALAGLVVIGVLLAYALLPLTEWLTGFARILRDLGGGGIALYFAMYTVVSLFLFPAAVLTLTAGFAWGAVGGLAVAIPAATIASCTAFLIGRFAFRGRIRHLLLKKPKLAAVERAINAKGPRLVFLMRFSPILPFPVLNYILGMTHLPFPGFALATALGMLPISFMYTYIGEIGAQLGGLDGDAAEVGPIRWVMLIVGIVATAGITFWVGKAARAALREVEAETRPQTF